MSRIAKLDVDAWDDGLRAFVGSTSGNALELGPSKITAHVPEIAKGLAQFGGALRAHRSLPERLMELVRLRIALAMGSAESSNDSAPMATRCAASGGRAKRITPGE